MKSFSILATVLAAVASAGPIGKRAVFTDTTFNDISISGGTAGNAQAEAEQALSGLPADLSTVEQADLDFLNSVNQVANDAEKEAFNPAIEAATGAEADSLQVSRYSGPGWIRRLPPKSVTMLIITGGNRSARSRTRSSS